MEIEFTVDNQKKVNPATDKDKRAWQAIRNKARPGTRLKFRIFVDRSTKQQRMYRAVVAYMRFASDRFAKNYPSNDALHASKVWEFCMMRPEYRVKKTVWVNGTAVQAEDVFSTSPNHGIDSPGMNEYTTWVLDDFAKALGVSVEQLLDASKKHAEGIDE